jgi:hypothetical protein
MGSIGKALAPVAGIAGSVIGGVVGGPAGAAIGGSIGGAVGGMMGGKTTQKAGNATNAASMAQLAYQQAASEKILQLMNDPSKVTSMGGFNTGIQAIERSAAGKGLLNSGNIMTALSDYGNSYYGDQMRLLQGLAAGTPNPTVGAGMINSGLGQQVAGGSGVGQGITQLLGMFGGSSGGGGLGSLLGSGGLGSTSGGYWPFESVSQTPNPGMDFLSFGGSMNTSDPLYTWDSGTGSISSGGSSFFDFGGF